MELLCQNFPSYSAVRPPPAKFTVANQVTNNLGFLGHTILRESHRRLSSMLFSLPETSQELNEVYRRIPQVASDRKEVKKQISAHAPQTLNFGGRWGGRACGENSPQQRKSKNEKTDFPIFPPMYRP